MDYELPTEKQTQTIKPYPIFLKKKYNLPCSPIRTDVPVLGYVAGNNNANNGISVVEEPDPYQVTNYNIQPMLSVTVRHNLEGLCVLLVMKN